ncbi:MAG TPA: hypothetical protein VGE93_04710 [Bryobacteraceae bacterium]
MEQQDPQNTPSPTGTVGDAQLDDLDLKVDDQAHKLIELKQKFTYFLVTAAVAILVFDANFLLNYGKINTKALALNSSTWVLMAAAISGTVSSSLSLLSVQFGHKAYTIHVRARYQRRTNLSPGDEQESKNLSNSQKWFQYLSTYALLVEIALSISFFVLLIS